MSSPTITSSDALIARAVEIARQGRRPRVAVAAAQDIDVISAVVEAQRDGFLDGTLVGDQPEIETMARQANVSVAGLELRHCADVQEAAHGAVALAANGSAQLVMKGFLPTSALLKVVLDKKYNLRGETTLSHCAVLEIPGYHKLLNITDGGMVVKPDLDQKFQILENAVIVGRALGCAPVKVALAAAVDRLSQRMTHTLTDAEHIIPRVLEQYRDVAVQGPITFDVATSKQAGEYQHVSGPVTGDADVYLVDSIEEGNIVAKSLIQFAGAVFAGVIMGAKVPVSLVSRTDTVRNKKASLALACLIAEYNLSQRSGKKL